MSKDSLSHLNPEQKLAVTHETGPLLIIAGAGSGKTTVVTERIKHLILEKQVNPSHILALTFTEKASREMEERVDRVMPYGYTQMWISTFHSFCDRILRQEAFHIGLDPAYKLATESEILLFLRRNIFKFELEYFRPLGNPTKFLSAMLQHFDRLRDEDVTPDEYIAYAHKLHKENTEDPEEVKKTLELAHAYKTFEELKIQESLMDFPNLLSATLKLFRERKNVLKTYQKQFEYVLIDEFQDTNFAQNELAILLAGDNRNITVVGDDDQAIYRWRGAAISNILHFRKTYPDAKVVTLTKNYRSSQTVLDTSYTLIQNNNPDRLEVKENINKHLEAMRKVVGDPVTFLFEERVEDEAEKVATQILELVGKKKNNLSFKDIAILVRANDHSIPFMRAFERFNIPFQFLGPGQLFQQEEIKDLIAYLKVLYNYEDSTSLYRVLTMQNFAFEPKDIANVLNFAKRNNYSLFEAMEQVQSTSLPQLTQQKFQIIVDLIKKHLGMVQKETAGTIMYTFLQETGLMQSLIDAKSLDDERRAKNIAKFFEKLKSFEAEFPDASVFSVVDWIEMSMQLGESPLSTDSDWAENDAVNILTIHGSKGLEFPVVFLVNLVSQRFPTRERPDAIPTPLELIKEVLPEGDYHIEEERRLFYVGMTRTKDKLFLTAAKYYGEGKREKKISPFVYEALGNDAVEKALKKEDASAQLSLFDWGSTQPAIALDQAAVSKSKIIVLYLSYSQIQTFDMCPLHYKLRYLLKVPIDKPAAAPTFGTSIHSTLQKFYQAHLDGEKVKPQDILTYLDQSWIKQGYGSRDQEKLYYERAKDVLTKYVENHFNPDVVPLSLETPFSFSLWDGNGGLKVGGRIDRVDLLPDGRIEIIDYKTGDNVPKEKDLAKNMQLTLYALAATKIQDKVFNRKPEEVLLTLHYIEPNIKLTTSRTLDELKIAEEEIIKKKEAIETSDFLCSRSFFCKECEYQMLCTTQSN